MPILHEYETLPVELTRAQAEALFATGVVDVRPSSDGRWLVTAGAHVGTLVVDGVELLIRPKIRPENLFLLLEPGLPDIAWVHDHAWGTQARCEDGHLGGTRYFPGQ